MRLPKLTTRRWMVLVILVGVGLAWSLHATRCLREAGIMEKFALIEEAEAKTLSTQIGIMQGILSTRLEPEIESGRAPRPEVLLKIAENSRKLLTKHREELEHLRRSTAGFAERGHRLRLAALFPWLSVPPQPGAMEASPSGQ